MSTTRTRLVLCRGQYCNAGRRADALLKILEPAVDAANGDDYPRPCKLEIANCLSLCGAGPNLIVYPEKVIYNQVDEARLREIIARHLPTAGE
ncbi:MAG: (2Fe-2S) ferredoxin domain-containing protein [bacterium]|nr:(2Fe-2S) ferredoxin domain-containing protein [bacterium]